MPPFVSPPLGFSKTRERKEAELGRERKLGLKGVGDTQLKPKSWVGARDCRGTGTRTREGKEAGLWRNEAWAKEGG